MLGSSDSVTTSPHSSQTKAISFVTPEAKCTAPQCGHYRAGHVERELHFIEGLAQVGSRNVANHGCALLADKSGLISENDSIQTAATVWITKR